MQLLILHLQEILQNNLIFFTAVTLSWDLLCFTVALGIIIIIYSLRVFHISFSRWFLTEVWVTASLLKSPGLSILAVLSNAIIWIVSTRPPTSKFSMPFNNPLVIVPKAPITIGTIVTFMSHSLFNFLARLRYLSFFSHSFSSNLWSAGTA